jgi:hypothetical protein
MNNLNVVQLSESGSITEALGINESRKKQLIKALMNAEFDSTTVTGIGEIVSKECVHPNELFFVSMMLGQKMTMEQQFSMMMQNQD